MSTIELNHITKVEGHGKLYVKVHKGEVEDVKFEIFEGARYYEGIVKGRMYHEIPGITQRICGICSQAHNIVALMAIENALGVKVSKQTRMLREILMNSSVIQSHVLHLYFLALPDYLGFDNALDMAEKHLPEVKRALKLKALANKMCAVIGGREIHSLTTKVGGFYSVPTQEQINGILKELKDAKKDIEAMVNLFGKIKVPEFERKTNYVCLKKQGSYPFTEGLLVTFDGKKFSQENYKKLVSEKVVGYSNAKLSTINNEPFFVGALARMNINRGDLTLNARKAINKFKVKFPNFNPYMNNFCQAIETLHLVDTTIKLLSELKIKEELPVEVKIRAGEGTAIVEAPRGILVHYYKLNAKGEVIAADIITPTAFNAANIESDVRELVPGILHLSKEQVVLEIEKLIRAYDPCISCSAHFIEVEKD